jgi:hypothetical protein
MKIAEIPFAVLRFQYQIARVPLQLIENQMAARLGSEAPARLFYERSLGAIDATVGNLLGDRELAKRGAALVERSDALGRAAQLDATATQNREQADATLEATRDDVVTDIEEARDAAEQEALDARITAEERKRAAERPRSAPPLPRSRPTTSRPSAGKRPKRPSVRSRPRFGRLRERPPKLPIPSSTTRRRNAAKLQPSARRPTGSRSWPTPRSRSANPSGRTTTDRGPAAHGSGKGAAACLRRPFPSLSDARSLVRSGAAYRRPSVLS